jgi:putative DNA primase/helicase
LPRAGKAEALRATNATCEPPLAPHQIDANIHQATTQPDRPNFVAETQNGAVTGSRRAVLTRMADIEAKDVDWLWTQRKARGILNLTVGDPGLGKTFLQLDIAARISRGAEWPDGGHAPLGDVILLSAEDHPAFTIRPRLDHLGADLTRIHILSAIRTNENAATDCPFSLTSDLALLEQVIDNTGAIAVFIDPVNAYFGTDHDSYKDTHIRAVLAPLSALAERRNVCIDGTMHLTKATDQRALYRVLGGVGFVASARLALAVAQHPEDENARVLLPLKQNICAPAETLAFRLTDGRLTWDSGPVIGLTADAVLGASVADQQVHQDTEQWLRQVLEDGPLPVSVLRAEAKAAGLSWRTIERTKASMRATIDAVKLGFNPSAWHWLLAKNATETAIVSNVAVFEAGPVKRGDSTPLNAKTATSSGVTDFVAVLAAGPAPPAVTTSAEIEQGEAGGDDDESADYPSD